MGDFPYRDLADANDLPTWQWITLGSVLAVCSVYVGGFFLGTGRTLYDLAAGTRVTSA